jgi:hypothetical protein
MTLFPVDHANNVSVPEIGDYSGTILLKGHGFDILRVNFNVTHMLTRTRVENTYHGII